MINNLKEAWQFLLEKRERKTERERKRKREDKKMEGNMAIRTLYTYIF